MTIRYLKTLSEKRDYFYWYKKNVPNHIIAIKPPKSFELNGIFVSFPLSLNSFAAFHR